MSKDRVINTCDTIIEACFYVLLIAVTFSTSLVEIASSIMILAWIIRKVTDRDWRAVDFIPVRVLSLFFLWVVLSCVNSDYFRESFRGIFKVAEYSLIFVIMATARWGRAAVKRFLFVAAGSTILVCFNGFFQYFSGEDLIRQRQLIYQDYLHRVSSSFVHPNDFGVYLLVMAVIFISLFLSRNSRLKNRLVMSAPVMLSVTSLFLTKSRGAWISFSAAFLVLGMLRSRRMLALFLAVLLVIFIMLPYTAQERIFNLTDLKGGTTWERLMLWKGTIKMIGEHPILGFGVNTYSRNFPRYKPDNYPDIRYSHNCYLHMASEVGVVGAFLFLIFFVTVLIYCLKGMSQMPGGIRKDLARGVFAGLVGFSLNCVVDTHLYSVNLAVFFHLLLGFCFALSYYVRKS